MDKKSTFKVDGHSSDPLRGHPMPQELKDFNDDMAREGNLFEQFMKEKRLEKSSHAVAQYHVEGALAELVKIHADTPDQKKILNLLRHYLESSLLALKEFKGHSQKLIPSLRDGGKGARK